MVSFKNFWLDVNGSWWRTVVFRSLKQPKIQSVVFDFMIWVGLWFGIRLLASISRLALIFRSVTVSTLIHHSGSD
uniref:Uncharacterized protein n=1 Tax=Rhizophagus irregularis (strain DAOM 181602 / DAOM 197198 / MUCL 43194) TaxID=747089 RepID=U9T9Y7_RHIID